PRSRGGPAAPARVWGFVSAMRPVWSLSQAQIYPGNDLRFGWTPFGASAWRVQCRRKTRERELLMNRILLGATLAIFGLFTSPAWAQAVPVTPPAPVTSSAPLRTPAAHLPALDDFDSSRGIEWGGYHVQMSLKLVRQPDGSYLAAVGGEKHAPRSGVVLSEAD